MADVLGKRADLTVIQIGHSPQSQWSVGGIPLSSGAWCASLVAHVTAGSNTSAEQAVFIDEAHRLLARVLDAPAGAPIYVIVNEVADHAWGYDGRTQAERRAQAAPTTLAPRTLRGLAGLPERAAVRPEEAALLLIDFQREYGPDGRLPLTGLGAAAQRAQRLVEAFDAQGALVIHVHHVARAEQGVPFASKEPGIAPLPLPAVLPGHRTLRKSWPSAFQDTELLAILQAHGVRQVVVAGAMTHNCVDSTSRAALHLGLEVIVAHDACATRGLPGIASEPSLCAEQIHSTALAALADRHASVVSVRDLTAVWADSVTA